MTTSSYAGIDRSGHLLSSFVQMEPQQPHTRREAPNVTSCLYIPIAWRVEEVCETIYPKSSRGRQLGGSAVVVTADHYLIESPRSRRKRTPMGNSLAQAPNHQPSQGTIRTRFGIVQTSSAARRTRPVSAESSLPSPADSSRSRQRCVTSISITPPQTAQRHVALVSGSAGSH